MVLETVFGQGASESNGHSVFRKIQKSIEPDCWADLQLTGSSSENMTGLAVASVKKERF